MKSPDREQLRTGERSCVWCHNAVWGDHGELLHVLCAPNLDQEDLFRADLQQLVHMDGVMVVGMALQAAVVGVGLSKGGFGWQDMIWALWFGAATAVVRFGGEEKVRITKGMWRRSRHQRADAAKARSGR